MERFGDAVLTLSGGQRSFQQLVHLGPSLQALHRGGQPLVGLLEFASPSDVALMQFSARQGGSGLLREQLQQQELVRRWLVVRADDEAAVDDSPMRQWERPAPTSL